MLRKIEDNKVLQLISGFIHNTPIVVQRIENKNDKKAKLKVKINFASYYFTCIIV